MSGKAAHLNLPAGASLEWSPFGDAFRLVASFGVVYLSPEWVDALRSWARSQGAIVVHLSPDAMDLVVTAPAHNPLTWQTRFDGALALLLERSQVPGVAPRFFNY